MLIQGISAAPERGGIEHMPGACDGDHRVAIGQAVKFSPDPGLRRNIQKEDSSQSFGCFPEQETRLSIPVKNEIDGQERLVYEDQVAGA
jgi:hypothetical protein